eukprot:CAMPEP_0204850754 /NCGR_PEP_ID=MMETSP1347-20130617/8768_1 /ASSEMBLY_ACC=CAM_ASM_000690 /TAXON_ID=215587 /ORGANISM="Aplanochytrium stocchinoi, Strain GSBS06" /LENGTH=434 /DNA_ID=CAMNT_0051993949 /DNA_START=33 /DNA_END=1334 /DNA_ORIENTATION=-
MFMGLGGGETCRVCAKRVYFAEQVKSFNEYYHKTCFRCVSCNRTLTPGQNSEHENEPYCKRCYTGSFGPHGFRGGSTGGLMGVTLDHYTQPKSNPKRDVPGERQTRVSAPKFAAQPERKLKQSTVKVDDTKIQKNKSSFRSSVHNSTTKQSSVYTSNISIQKGGTALLIIDPQVDFHDGGSLAVPGADEDAERIKSLIESSFFFPEGRQIREIYVTLDSHMKYHIAHSQFWIDPDSTNTHPEPFTAISTDDIEQNKWVATRKEHREWAKTYVKSLKDEGNFELIIWPDHCLIGTPGHCVQPDILGALHQWEAKTGKTVQYILKGTNSKTEHYSAIKAEVVVPEDKETTGVNHTFVNELKQHDRILICGQALSHCLNYTTRDLVDNWGDKSLSSLIVLEDATSPVKGFEEAGEKFIEDMRKKGLQIMVHDQSEIW